MAHLTRLTSKHIADLIAALVADGYWIERSDRTSIRYVKDGESVHISGNHTYVLVAPKYNYSRRLVRSVLGSQHRYNTVGRSNWARWGSYAKGSKERLDNGIYL